MRLTIEDAALLKDRFEDFIDAQIGQDVVTRRNPDAFTVEILRKQARVAHIRPQLEEDMDCNA